jgi:sensor histidine kinase YesM
VPWELRNIRIPALVIQPLVENAIKHGISESAAGGEVRICARRQPADERQPQTSVLISVSDTGVGAADSVRIRKSTRGLGLTNIEQRLRRYGSAESPLSIRRTPETGTVVELRIPIPAAAVESVLSVKSW